MLVACAVVLCVWDGLRRRLVVERFHPSYRSGPVDLCLLVANEVLERLERRPHCSVPFVSSFCCFCVLRCSCASLCVALHVLLNALGSNGVTTRMKSSWQTSFRKGTRARGRRKSARLLETSPSPTASTSSSTSSTPSSRYCMYVLDGLLISRYHADCESAFRHDAVSALAVMDSNALTAASAFGRLRLPPCES